MDPLCKLDRRFLGRTEVAGGKVFQEQLKNFRLVKMNCPVDGAAIEPVRIKYVWGHCMLQHVF
jgi:hypothetical protein